MKILGLYITTQKKQQAELDEREQFRLDAASDRRLADKEIAILLRKNHRLSVELSRQGVKLMA